MNRVELKNTLMEFFTNPALAFYEDILREVHTADVAEATEELLLDKKVGLKAVATGLTVLSKVLAGSLFSFLGEDTQEKVFNLLGCEKKVEIFKELSGDDRVDLLRRLSPSKRADLYKNFSTDEVKSIKELASFEEGTAGSETSNNFIFVKPEETVADALKYVRENAARADTIYVVYVVDVRGTLLGTVSLRDLVVASADKTVGEIMHSNPVTVKAEASAKEAIEKIRHYDLLAIPVIVDSGRMIGIITVDDAIDVGVEDDASDLTKFGGAGSISSPDLDLRESSFKQLFGVRVFWLILLTLFGMVTSTFVAAQEEMLEQVIILAAFIAPIVDMGGNTGSQSATLVLRGMALGNVALNWRDVWFVIKREIPVALALGVVISILEGVLAYFSKGVSGDVLWVVGLAMAICTCLGGIIGALLPFMARMIGTDPATLSSPLITSIMDLIGVFIYFGLAYVFLGDMLTGAVA